MSTYLRIKDKFFITLQYILFLKLSTASALHASMITQYCKLRKVELALTL